MPAFGTCPFYIQIQIEENDPPFISFKSAQPVCSATTMAHIRQSRPDYGQVKVLKSM